MALPAVTAGVRLAMAIAKHAGKKLVKKGTRGYKLSRSLVKSKRARTRFAKSTVRKSGTALKYASKQASTIGKGTKRHLKFYSNVLAPGGIKPNKFLSKRGLKHLITRPTFGEVRPYPKGLGQFQIPKRGNVYKTHMRISTKGRKTRGKIMTGGLYSGIIGYRTLKD